MSYRQLREPDSGIKDYAGSCLRMTRTIYNVGAQWYTAWEAWDATKHFSRSRSLPPVSVPVWFDWTGHVPGHGRKRFGHVAAWIPGKGILSSPMSGYGQKWYPTIAALEADMSRATGSPVRYVGWSLDINGVLVAEKTAAAPKPVKGKGTKVKHHYQRRDKTANGKGRRVIKPGTGLYLNERNTTPSNATNIVGGIGYYSITPHLYIKGTPGDVVELKLIWQDTKAKPRRNSAHYIEQVEIGANGLAKRSVESKRHVSRGYAVYVRVDAPKTNKGSVDVQLLASDAYLFG